MKVVICCSLLVAAVSFLLPSSAASQCSISGTSTAALVIGGPFDGLYKYTLELTWDTGGAGLSHLTIDLNLDTCSEACLPGMFQMDSPAGTSDGDGGCVAEYVGLFECDGDPTIPLSGPVIKFEDIQGDGCDAAASGSGTFCFYSPLLPDATPEAGNLWIKFSGDTCSGDLVGDMPACTPPVPVTRATWGAIKALY